MDIGEFLVDHNLKCHVCGENQFEERGGFYYCRECGTKQEQVRLIEVEHVEDFDPEKLKTKTQKIHVSKAEKPQLTSWECYNYILRGFVEEMLSYGAKEELKLMTLQIWAAYLRRIEVAFFNRKQPDLPKLGIRYLQNDAQTIYNQIKKARKRRQRKRSEDASCTSDADSRSFASFRRSKHKLDVSNYSLTSVTSGGSGLTSSTSTNSNRAIRMNFNRKSRAYLKKKMPVKHIAKHEVDAEGLLTCHKQPTSRQISRLDNNLMLVNIKQIYSILAIALNLIGDEIQLSDLVRFIHEGHIGTSNVLQYFPENIASDGKEILKNINFNHYPEKYSDKALRDHIGILCKNIGIHALQKPDIIKLVRRYITELCLPTDFADYIERLINLLPPKFETRVAGYYSGFEARAMAYIIFTLKLFFGLDDEKEYRISQASQKLNSKIQLLNRLKQEKQPPLFVWDEWVEYIEMRKIIVSQFNTSFCEQFKQCQSTNQLLEQMEEEIRRDEERDNLHNDKSKNLGYTQKFENLRSLFVRFQETYKLSNKDKQKTLRIEFKPSFTPAYSYLKTILLFCENEANTDSSIHIKIPEFMHIDHSERDIISYLQVKPLISFFKSHQLKLNIHVLATTENKRYVGIFRSPRYNHKNYKFHKACFKGTEEEWSQDITDGITKTTDDLEFVTNLRTYGHNYARKKQNSKREVYFDAHMNYDFTTIRNDMDNENRDNEEIPKRSLSPKNLSHDKNKSTLITKKVNEDLQSMHSFDLFSENNMEPVDRLDFITKPRRNLENIDLFEGISDEESVLNDDDGDDANMSDDSQPIILNEDDPISLSQALRASFKSRQPTPSTLEEFVKIEPVSPNTAEEEKRKSCESNDALKMYISNMDCWLMLGSISLMTKAQNTQLQDTFPRSFNWLLQTCAQTINVEWIAVFEQLLCIETMFCLGINDLDNIKNCIYMNFHNPMKEIQMILKIFQQIW